MKHRLGFIHERLLRIKRANLYRSLLYNKVSGPHIIVGKKKLVNLSSNDYLGLGSTRVLPSQIQSSSRLVAGNDSIFERLERSLASHKSQQGALVFPTGYMANLGIISILAEKNDLILSDSLNHASIIDSCRLSRAKKALYHHNDIADLEKKLERRGRRKFVITEGIFSMNGDFSMLKEITGLCQRHGAILVLDDAHGDFVAGPDGKGTASHLGVARKIDVYISSLSKGLGAFGGYVASKGEVIDLAVNTSRSFIYTSALPNFLAQAALDKIASNREVKRAKLWKNVALVRRGLASCGYQVDSQSQIIPVIIGDEKKAVDFSRYLFANGVFAQAIRYPTVERGASRIRISVTAWLSSKNIEKSLDVFETAGKKFGIT